MRYVMRWLSNLHLPVTHSWMEIFCTVQWWHAQAAGHSLLLTEAELWSWLWGYNLDGDCTCSSFVILNHFPHEDTCFLSNKLDWSWWWCRSLTSLSLNQLASNVDKPDQKISGWVILLCIYSCRRQMCNVETVCDKIRKHYWFGSRFQNIIIQLSLNYYVCYYLFFGAGSSRADSK